ncbi:MAG: 6-pyruvoyl-tetrahydropterin synthase-related protein [Candidatus Shapirobacteria bacterium]
MRFKPLALHFPLLLFLLILPSVFFLFQNSIYFNMHDDMQLVRQLEMDKCLEDGQIPCRWTPDLGYGYGYPLFNFYPPLPYLIGSTIRLTGFSYINTVKLTFALQFFVLSLGSYFLALFLFKNKLSALLVSLLLNYAPYHAVNVYVRGAQNESWALAFFPWILFFGLKLIKSYSQLTFVGLSISTAFLLLCHLPMSLVFFPSVLVLFVIYYLSLNRWRLKLQPQLFSFILSLFLGITLSAFFIIPASLESKNVQIESMFTNYYHFSVHFTSLKQLFISNFWGDGPSVWGQADLMSFSIGYLQWIIPLISLIWLAINFYKTKKLTSLDVFIIATNFLGLFFAFLTHQRSDFIWTILTPLQKVQFPWRLLNPTIFYFSLSVGWLVLQLPTKKIKSIFSAGFIFLLFALNITKFYPITYGPITDAQKFSGLAWTNQITSGIYDYLPKTSPKAPTHPPLDIIDVPNPAISLTNYRQGTDWGLINLHASVPTSVTLGLLSFTGLSFQDNSQPIGYAPDAIFGRPIIKLTAGNHQIYYHYQNTPLRLAANIISLISLLILAFLLLPIFTSHVSNYLRRSKK